MTRQEILRQVGETQISFSAYNAAVASLTQMYLSAALLNDTVRMNDIRRQVHDNMDLALDAHGHIAYLTHALTKLNDF